jgi:hypothetical protein
LLVRGLRLMPFTCIGGTLLVGDQRLQAPAAVHTPMPAQPGLRSRFRCRISTANRLVRVGPRGCAAHPLAETDGARALIGFQPFLFEGFLREVGEPAAERVLPPPLQTPPDRERLLSIGARNGMEILGPPGPPPAH